MAIGHIDVHINVHDLHTQQASGHVLDLVDVRGGFEYASGHVAGARLLPLSQVTPEAVRAGRPPDAQGPTYVICHSGGRSQQVCQRLAQAGMTDVVNVDGGTAAWKAAGLAVEPATKSAGLPAWSRTAGLLAVLACLVMAWTVQPWFAFVGLGLWLALLVARRGACPLGACAGAREPDAGDRA